MKSLLLALFMALLVGVGWAQDAEPEPEQPPAVSGGPSSVFGTLTDPLVRMSVRPLAGGHFRPGEWTGLIVRLENLGDDLQGEIATEISGQDFHSIGVRRTVELPAGSRRELVLPIKGPTRVDRLRVDFRAGRRSTYAEARMRPIGTSDLLIGVIGEDLAGVNGLHEVDRMASRLPPGRGNIYDASRDRGVRSGLLPVSSLPEHPQLFEPFNWLVWLDADPSSLTPAQAEALHSYIASGGHLVLTVTERWRQVGQGPLQDLLPVDLTGVRSSEASSELADALRFASPIDSPQPQAIARLRSQPGREAESLLEVSGDPVWAAGTYGRGTVHVLTVDPRPMIRVSDTVAESFWRQILYLPAPGSGTLAHPLDRESALLVPLVGSLGDESTEFGEQLSPDDTEVMNEVLRNIPGVQPIPLSWLVAFAAVYLLLIGPVDFLVLRWLRREVLTWITFPVTILVFSALALAGTTYVKGTQTVLTRYELVEIIPGTPYWHGSSMYGFWATQRVRLSLESGVDSGLAEPLEGHGLSAQLDLVYSASSSAAQLTAQTWALAFARTSFAAKRPGDLSVSRDADGSYVVRNTLPYDLERVMFCGSGMSTLDIGGLKSGAEIRFRPERATERTFDPKSETASWVLSMGCHHRPARWRPLTHLVVGSVVAELPAPAEPSVLHGMDPQRRSFSVLRRPVYDHELSAPGATP
ncbi:MAG: hypothetical protein EA397_13475 [Deltaproteobacteria bacterium]|nr:MAG: hypothetical protein EA397_13475 [Deltaproteobacteria bacterium]